MLVVKGNRVHDAPPGSNDHATRPADLVTDNGAAAAHRVTIEHTFESAHRLPHLAGKCASLHGHSWRVTVTVTAPCLSHEVTVVEFGALKTGVRNWIDTHLDHATMLGARDPLVEPLTAAGCTVFRFGAHHTATTDAELLAADLTWPTAGRPADEQETLHDCGPVLDSIVKRIPDAVRAIRAQGRHELCPHLTYDAPAVGIWLAWKPDRVRCPKCADHTLTLTSTRQKVAGATGATRPHRRPPGYWCTAPRWST
jgi:6-pyruvoyltetrahydropterin/6-carboxytetrahydropterin synthase